MHVMFSWDTLRSMFNPVVMYAALRVAIVVGTLLSFINHYDLLLGVNITPNKMLQIVLNYCIPYIVSIHGQVLAGKAARTPK